mgnify:CR=1 FL=1
MIGVIYFASMLLIGFLLGDYFEIIIAVAFVVWCLGQFIYHKVADKTKSHQRSDYTDDQKSEIENLKKQIDEKNEKIRYLESKAYKDFRTYENTLFRLEKELDDQKVEHERNLELALAKQREELLESVKNKCSEDYNKARAFYTKIKSKDPFFDKPTREKYLKAFKDARLDRAFASYLTAPSKVTINAEIPSFTEKDKVYKTSLEKCNCDDYHNPCKHMIGLALYYNAVYNMPEVKEMLENTVKARDETKKREKEIKKEQRKQQKKSK